MPFSVWKFQKDKICLGDVTFGGRGGLGFSQTFHNNCTFLRGTVINVQLVRR